MNKRRAISIKNISLTFFLVSTFYFIFLFLMSFTYFVTPVYAWNQSECGQIGCSWHTQFGCVGWRGCEPKGSGCASGFYDAGQGYCCHTCTPDCGTCNTCTPTCSGYYTVTSSNGCSSDTFSCTRYYSVSVCGSCGTSSRTCWLVKYTVNFSAGSGGSISGTTSQSICRGSNTTNVTAVPNTGYKFVSWSDGNTNATRNKTNVTAAQTITASFELDNQAPTAPTNLLCQGATNPAQVTTLTPYFSAIFNDPNVGDKGEYYQIQVNTSSDFNGTTMWDSGVIAMSSTNNGARSPNITYNGNTLSMDGSKYYWRIRFADNYGAVGEWSTVADFTMNTAPSASTNPLCNGQTNPIKVSTSTPYFSAIFNDPNVGDKGEYYQIQVNTSSDFNGTTMWDSGVIAMSSTNNGARSPNITYNGNTLSMDGSKYYWRIRFADNHGVLGEWSTSQNFFTTSGSPTASVLHISNTTNPYAITLPLTFSAIYTDPNNDNAAYYQIQVNTLPNFNGTTMWDSGKTAITINSGNRSASIIYNGTTLNHNSTVYYVRMRFWDTDGNASDWTTGEFTDDIRWVGFEGLDLEGLDID